jgi:tight adherence protein C
MLIAFIVEVGCFLVLFILSRGRYRELLSSAQAKEYKLSHWTGPGMRVMELAGYRFTGKYDRKIAKMLMDLYGSKNIDCHLRLFYGEKLTLSYFLLLLCTLFSAVSGESGGGSILAAIGLPAGVFFLYDKELESKLKKRIHSIRGDFPDLVTTLVLLMTMNRAWEKICTETKKSSPLFEELKTTYLQIQGGKGEAEAYEEFARRCKVKEVTKFVSLIIQNLKKGSADLIPLIRLQAEECWELRKMRAKQLGEEASAKLMLPMMIMFVGILIIVILPAVLQLGSF